LLRTLGRQLQAVQLAVDLRADAVRYLGRHIRDLRKGVDQLGHARRIGRAALQLLVQPFGFGSSARASLCDSASSGMASSSLRVVTRRFLVARIHLEQIGVADDLIQTRGALKCADFLEHALIVASAPDAVIHQLFAAVDSRFICTAAFTMAKSSGAATIVKPISMRPLSDLGRGNRMAGILAA